MKVKSVKLLVAAAAAVVIVAAAGWWLARRGRGRVQHVILISIDTLRADHLGCYGYPGGITPNIDRLASEGVRFANAVTPVPLTLPGHASMLTGTIPPCHGAHHNEGKLAESSVTLAEVLRQAGYTTGAIVSTFVLDSQTGLAQGFDTYQDEFPVSPKGIAFSQQRGERTSELAVQWLKQHADDKAFFLFLHYFDPHTPYDPPGPFVSQWADDLYAGEVAYADHCVGRVLDTLKELRLYDSSLIILTSDHGEMRNEHGEPTHGYFIYESAIKVPLILKLPGQRQRPSVDDVVVGLVDIVPTVCAILDVPDPPAIQGEDLSAYLNGRTASNASRRLYCESLTPQKLGANGLWGVVGRRWKYIHTTQPELYDVSSDPGETRDLVRSEPHRVRLLAEELREILERAGSQAEHGKVTVDAQRRARLQSLGYVAGGRQSALEFDADKDDPKGLIGFHNDLSRALFDLYPQGKRAEAIRLVGPLVAQRPQVYASRVLLAALLMETQRYREALAHYEAVLKDHGYDMDVLAERGRVRQAMGDLLGALTDFDQVLRQEPEHVTALMNRGLLRGAQNNLRGAIADWSAVIRVAPSIPGAWYNRAVARRRLGDEEGAIADLKQCLQQTSVTPRQRQRIGRLLQQLGGEIEPAQRPQEAQ